MRLKVIVPVLAAALAGTLLLTIEAFSASPPGPLFASLNGHNEVPDADPDGTGSFSAIVDGNQFCYGMTAANIETPVAAHVHRGHAGENGPIVIGLAHPITGDPGSSSACLSADPGLLEEILQKPSQFYVNVHNAPFPGGAIRDQLVRHTR